MCYKSFMRSLAGKMGGSSRAGLVLCHTAGQGNSQMIHCASRMPMQRLLLPDQGYRSSSKDICTP